MLKSVPGRMVMLKWAVCAALLSELAVSPRLWTADHAFPIAPAIKGFPEIPPTVTVAVLILFVLAILAAAILSKPRWAIVAVLILGGVLVASDIDRLQPWFYEFMLLLIGLSAAKTGNDQDARPAWAACAIVVSATYFWSGVQKANAMFATDTFPWLLGPFHLLKPLWFLVPIVEASVGVLLLIPKTRKIGLIGAIGMHLFLLVALGPLGHNYNQAVWPWNLWLIAISVILFWQHDTPILPQAWRSWTGITLLTLAGIMPALSFFGLWDQYLSASLYSGRAQVAFVVLSEHGRAQVPERLKRHVHTSPEGNINFDLDRWALEELNVPPYPEVRVYREIGDKLHDQGIDLAEMRLFVTKMPGLQDTKTEYMEVPIE